MSQFAETAQTGDCCQCLYSDIACQVQFHTHKPVIVIFSRFVVAAIFRAASPH